MDVFEASSSYGSSVSETESSSQLDTSSDYGKTSSSNSTRSDSEPPRELDVKSLTIVSMIELKRTLRMSYSAHVDLFVEKLLCHKWFEEGKVLRTLEKGVLHPVLHFTTLEADESQVCLVHKKALGREYNLYQALYQELDAIELPVISQDAAYNKNICANCSTAYLVLGFRSFDEAYNRVFEENWKDLTGARSIYLNLSANLGLSRLSFLKRIRPKDLNSFVYILYAVCTTVTEQGKLILLDFTQRLRLRMLGHLAIYSHVTLD